VVADFGPLVNGSVATDYNPVANLNLARKRNTVCDNAVVADNVVVCNVNVCHKEVAATDYGLTARSCTTADGYILANIVVVANLGSCYLATEFQILWKARNRSCGVNLIAFADACAIVDYGTWANPTIVADNYVAGNICKWFYGYVLAKFSVGVNVC
jgi:hypothetical protein